MFRNTLISLMFLVVSMSAACSGSTPTCASIDPPDLAGLPDQAAQDLVEELPPESDVNQFDTASDVSLPDGIDFCSVTPAPFGCPCEGNTDCVSGFCVEGPYGYVCSQTCIEDCPEGWTCRGIQGFGSDVTFVCVPSSKKLCYPCQTDIQCGSAGVCVQLVDGSYCSFKCTEDNPCPDGFSCKTTADQAEPVCQPESGSCECTGDSAGQIRPCTRTNEYGTCFGYETCEAGVGFVDCTATFASPEVCDGVDNDCDGLFDEELPLSRPCEKTLEGVGVCQGEEFCFGAQGWVCTAAEPSDEICDYKDNDCNGLIDETFTDPTGTKYVDFNNCGSCGTSCGFGFPNATAICDAQREVPQCVVESCAAGFFKLNDFQCVPLIASLCEPCAVDESCVVEGAKCIELSDGKFCTKPCSESNNCPPGYSCEEMEGSGQCVPLSGSCSCDGTNLLLSKSCTASWPVNPDPGSTLTICYGTQKCTTTGWTDCILPDDVCDGADNDCNGVIDDGFLVNGKYVTDTHCGKCGNNCTFVTYTNGKAICDASLENPACAMACLDGFQDVNNNPNDGCECKLLSTQDLPDGIDQNCDGVDGELLNAVFVAKNGDDEALGSREAPMLTIQAAIAKAAANGLRDVYVATGVYNGSISLVSGVQVYGGYSSDFLVRDIVLYETAIIGGPTQASKPGAVNAISLPQGPKTVFSGFTVFGRNASTPSGSSYAIYIKDCGSSLEVSDNYVVAGHGANGSPGTGGIDGNPGVPGTAGKAAYGLGTFECNASSLTKGGLGGTNTCGGTDVSGGGGGSNTCPVSGAPGAIEAGQNGAGISVAAGGAAGWDGTLNFDCSLCTLPSSQNPPKPMEGEPGAAGAHGAQGAAGAGCSVATGLISAGLWQPGAGSPGGFGQAGSGGGGGGVGGGADRVSYSPTCGDMVGGTGGGGGSGGCPGTSGTGGGGGGGSFAIFLLFTTPPTTLPLLQNNSLEGGMGGAGGSGGYGGTGGPGGAGGYGGTGGLTGSNSWCSKGGGNGGNGGNAGHGGGGGGGCGGVSYCIYVFSFGGGDFSSIKNASNPCSPGQGGAGGAGGPSVGNPGTNGATGTAAPTNI